MIYQIIALLIWASSFIVAKIAYTQASFDPVLLVQMRIIVAALIVLPMFIQYAPSIEKSQWKPLIFTSFVNHVVMLMLQFIGLKYTSASSAITIIGLEPLLVIFIGHFFFHDKAQWYHWLCGALAFLGVALLVWGGGEESGKVSLWGCSLILLSCVAFAYVMRPTQKLIRQIGVSVYTSASFVLSVFTCLPFTLLLTENWTVKWNASGIFSLLYLGVGCGWLAYLLWNKGISKVSANLSGILTALEPILGVALAVVILNEKVSLIAMSGIVMVVTATLVATLIPMWQRPQSS